jgi:ABC-type lipopolysaccharide export system ATPase subunit
MLCLELAHRTLRHRTQPERARQAIVGHGLRKELAELARGLAPREVHLQEALAGVDPPLGAQHVVERLRAHGRHIGRIEFDDNGRGQRGQRCAR